MNMHLYRKKIIILALSVALAATSYWIPLPSQAEAHLSPSRLFGPTDQTIFPLIC